MPAIAVIGDTTTGHDGFPPTKMVQSPVSKTKINGKKPGVVDPACQFLPHQLGLVIHPQQARYPIEGSSKTKIEGYYIARIADKLSCGDISAGGSENSFVE
jgi:uncharacterized Zn-binding protein involved in type VI secretion